MRVQVGVWGEVESLHPEADGPLLQSGQGGVEDDHLASLVRQGVRGVG